MKNNHKGKAIVLLYHQVGKKPIEQTNLDCYCDQSRFEEQMAYLYDSHYKVISLDELVSRMKTQKLLFKEHYVVLTFDDGCNTFSEIALPILKKNNFPSTIYPVAGCLGQVASWPKVINPDLNIISELKLKELSSQGVNIGAHTMNHVKLSTCSLDVAKDEIAQSKYTIEHLIGKEITSFSYPHGDYNEDIYSLIKILGFSNAVTCNSNSIDANTDLFKLPRKYVTYYDTINTFKEKLFHE